MIPTREQELAVIESVIYASLFDYPLSLEQLHNSLVRVRTDASTIAAWWRQSERLQAAIDVRDGWYFPAGRADLIATRARREAVSRELLVRDRRVLSVIANLPFVRMVALSGSLAHLNAEGSADLDLFVITAPGRAWSVTVAAIVIAKLLGCRKRVCLNYVVSEKAMKIEPEDLFSANQIIHLRPLSGFSVFARFVKANGFIRSHYPNFELDPQRTSGADSLNARTLFERALAFGIAPGIERVARGLYGWHLRRRAASWQSRDQVRLEAECLKLHTTSHRAATLEKFDRAMAAAGRHLPASIKVLAS